jgi:hypothetical protein
MTSNVIHFPKIIRHQGQDIDLDKIVRIKPTFYGGRHVGVYFDDCFVEYDDPDGSLYAAMQKNGIAE